MAVVKKVKVDANPTKAFFVRMITRDISLEDCILDLIDNSVDGAWDMEGGRSLSLEDRTDLQKYKIEIEATPKQFRILDNCGGITLDQAVEYAFTFGRKETDSTEDYSIGVYGIGMKRAVFKLGNEIRITSTFEDSSGERSTFVVPINVSKWLSDDGHNWDFDLEIGPNLSERGVEIVVRNLHETTSAAFSDAAFLNDLRKTISRDYALHLRRGLKIFLNGQNVRGWNIELLQGGGMEPMRQRYTDEESGFPIDVELLAGMAAPPPESSEPSESTEPDHLFGWYIVCNGRIVLAADKTSLTGWGSDGFPQWHPQYAGFMGIVLFTAKDATLLPLTTTKRSIDESSGVYRRAKPKMREGSRQWIDYTNARKQALIQAKEQEGKAKPLSIFKVAPSDRVLLPKISSTPKRRVANIGYSVPYEKATALAKGFGNINMTYRDIGIKSFDHAYADLVGDDD